MATMTAAPPGCTQQRTDPRAGKYLTFHLGKEEFAIKVMRVREIMGVPEINAVPQTPAYVKGVINLRGKVIPVVDLRMKFGLAEAEYTQRTCIVVVNVDGSLVDRSAQQPASVQLQMGVIVDAVAEVLTLQASDIEDTPDFGSGVALPYLLGMAKTKGKVKILLDINRVLSAQEMAGLGPL